jgi:hypothetical protein
MAARKDPRAIANDLKEKYKTSPQQTCGENQPNAQIFTTKIRKK